MIKNYKELPENIRDIKPYMCWTYGSDKWKWSKDAECYILGDMHGIKAICLGERYAHASYGKDSYGILWDGSTISDWHSNVSMKHLGEALDWIKKAERPDLGFILWSDFGKQDVKVEYSNKYV